MLNCLLLCYLSHGFEFGLVRQIIQMCLTCIEEALILQACVLCCLARHSRTMKLKENTKYNRNMKLKLRMVVEVEASQRERGGGELGWNVGWKREIWVSMEERI